TKGNSQNNGTVSIGVHSVWKVETLLRPQFSLNKDARYNFYITSNHEHHQELLALLKEKTGLKIKDPTKKPKILPWQPGRAR
ncbi:MAG: hypothetical protein V2J07_08440, partial [Anaerolineae bacterium]|nr:hypothetical protein [Anaerolineae bacterium]